MSMVNPEMMQTLMNNPEIQKMMKDPNLMNKFNDVLGENKSVDETLPNLNPELFEGLSNHVNNSPDEASCNTSNCCPDEASCNTSNCCPDEASCNPSNCCPDEASCNPSNCCPDEASCVKYKNGTKITTCNLKNESYNNKNGIVEDKLENDRYVILFDDGRIASIKEYNLEDKYENIENIE